MNCVIEDYIKFINNFLYNYYRTLLGSKYEKKLVNPFIDKYIEVRYYNNSIYATGSILDKINRELKLVAKELIKQDMEKETKVKNIFCLFGYILYLDDCAEYPNINALLKSLYNDEDVELAKDLNKDEFKNLIKNFDSQKKEFFKLFDNKYFTITEKRVAKKLYLVDIDQNCNITPLYSKYAIDKAYNTGVVLENKTYLEYVLLSAKVLKEAIELDFSKNYIVDFPESLFEKSAKINKYLKVLDNDLAKSKINIRFTYTTYLNHKKEINSFINEGFNVAIVLDEKYDNDISCLVLFSYVFIYEKYEYYDNIIDDRDKISANIVTL